MVTSQQTPNSLMLASHPSSRLSGSYPQLTCYHNEIASLRVVKHNGPTMGKRFYGCNHWPRACGYFKWEGELVDVPELQELVKDLKSKSLILQNKLIEELRIENTEKDLAVYSSCGDKKILLGM
ncbi:Protein ZGRF1, partial [Bienertia sinuspersici]